MTTATYPWTGMSTRHETSNSKQRFEALYSMSPGYDRRHESLTRGHTRPNVLRHARQWLLEGRTKRLFDHDVWRTVLRLGRVAGNDDQYDSTTRGDGIVPISSHLAAEPRST